MDHALKILGEQKALISQEIEEMQELLREKKAALRSLEDAIMKLGGAQPIVVSSKSLKELIEEAVRAQDEGLTPKDLAEMLTRAGRVTSQQSVSSTLSRLKGEGVVDSTSGGKWVAKKNEAPPPQGDSAFGTGPGDGSRGQQSTGSPEGSIPSGSTLHRNPFPGLDDEIPF